MSVEMQEKVYATQNVIDKVRNDINKAITCLLAVEDAANELEKLCHHLNTAIDDGSEFANAIFKDLVGNEEKLLAKFKYAKGVIANGSL